MSLLPERFEGRCIQTQASKEKLVWERVADALLKFRRHGFIVGISNPSFFTMKERRYVHEVDGEGRSYRNRCNHT